MACARACDRPAPARAVVGHAHRADGPARHLHSGRARWSGRQRRARRGSRAGFVPRLPASLENRRAARTSRGSFATRRAGLAIACCSGISNTVVLRKPCSIACCCTSPPGVPNGMKSRPFDEAIAGAGAGADACRGDHAGCEGSSQPCEPRGDPTQPTPGIAGESTLGSSVRREKPLPSRRATAT